MNASKEPALVLEPIDAVLSHSNGVGTRTVRIYKTLGNPGSIVDL
jgi:hypothetical protein